FFMARGGARVGAGRKKGIPNKRTQALQAAVEETGLTPLAYMLQVMRDETADIERRDEMARAAAPYIHARLTSVTGADGGPVKIEDVTHSQLARWMAFELT